MKYVRVPCTSIEETYNKNTDARLVFKNLLRTTQIGILRFNESFENRSIRHASGVERNARRVSSRQVKITAGQPYATAVLDQILQLQRVII